MIKIIVARSKTGVIGSNNQLPWHLPADLKHFKETTSGHPIIMGRKTWDSLGRPLPNRRNMVISRQTDLTIVGAEVFSSLEEALVACQHPYEMETKSVTKLETKLETKPENKPKTELDSEAKQDIFIIGGAQIYQQALAIADQLIITEVEIEVAGDAYFPQIDQDWQAIARESFPSQINPKDSTQTLPAYAFVHYARKTVSS